MWEGLVIKIYKFIRGISYKTLHKIPNFQEKFLLQSEIITYCIAKILLNMEQNLFFLVLKIQVLAPDNRNGNSFVNVNNSAVNVGFVHI